jgi:ABC-2 type transport system ATP-binding protein
MIQIEHLTKEFASGLRAVDDITLEVRSGEVFGFLGPNGAGKTTTIKILTTLLRPSSGMAVVAGYDVVENPISVRMSFGYVGQQSGVDPALTPRENLLLQGRLYHLPSSEISKRMTFLLDLFDLTGAADQLVGSLSGGMKRKLDIATALIHEPKLLFLDEPTLGLDPKSRTDLWTHIRRLNKEQGVTLFLTTHYLEEVDQLANRVGILDQGRIQTIGTPDQLKDSLGADCIHLSFKSPLAEPMLAFFRQMENVKEIIPQGEKVRLYIGNGRHFLPKILQSIEEKGLTPESVVLTRPTLDDVYLKYTGKSLVQENKNEVASSSGGWGKWTQAEQEEWWSKKRGKEGPAEKKSDPKQPQGEKTAEIAPQAAANREAIGNEDQKKGEQAWSQGAWKNQWTQAEQEAWWSKRKAAEQSQAGGDGEKKGEKDWPQGEWKDQQWNKK